MKKLRLITGIIAMVILFSLSASAQTAPTSDDDKTGLPQTQQIFKQKVVDTKFKLVIGGLLASTAFDIETTFAALKHCKNCREGNPIMRPFIKSGRPATYAVELTFAGVVTYHAYKMKKHGKKYWWLGPVIATGIHAAAGSLNLRFAF